MIYSVWTSLSLLAGKRDRIKAFFCSRPMKETSLKKVVAKIKRREELRKDAAQNEVIRHLSHSFCNMFLFLFAD